MAHLSSIHGVSAGQLIGLLAIKLIALSVAVAISEEKGRELLPLIGVAYAAALPFMLWIFAP